MNTIGEGVNYAKESINKMPDAESMKTAALNTCHSAIETCRGSGSVTEELKKLGSAYLGLAFTPVSALKSCGQLLTGQVGEAVNTVKEACGPVGQIAAFPSAATLAIAGQSVESAKKISHTVADSPFAFYRTCSEGLGKLTGIANKAVESIPGTGGKSTTAAGAMPPSEVPNDNTISA
jgi:hypothetical protein